MDLRVLDLDAPVIFFPVRHHSPACARAVSELIERVRPAAVLIEGPHDFTPRIDELLLPHRLPVAIYTWVAGGEDTASVATRARHGAFYPFCIYSPEWQSLQAGRRVGARLEFIDRPWQQMASERVSQHRYAEPELRHSSYVTRLCQSMGAPDLDALWDRLFEIEALPLPTLWERLHHFCYALRASDGNPFGTDLSREAFMAQRIRAAIEAGEGPIVVVTGGFHSYALYARLHGLDFEPVQEPRDITTEQEITWEQGGVALTPYSYERLDALRGYEAGMPNPGFYDRVWNIRHGEADESKPPGGIGRSVLADVARDLRRRKQVASSADLIAALGTGEALAVLRGHSELWRRDLVDGVVGALVKDELAIDGSHPFLEAVHDALRGTARGRLADGTLIAPLAADLKTRLESLDLDFEEADREVDLNLRQSEDLQKSRLLHQARVLGLQGFERTAGSDWAQRDDLSRVTETWHLRWSTAAQASIIEASIYGATIGDAAEACLLEKLAHAERDAEAAALLLLDAALMGRVQLVAQGFQMLQSLVRSESDPFRLSRALGHLLYLYRFDAALGSAGESGIGALLREAWERGIWLLENLGASRGRDKGVIQAIGVLVDVLERCELDLELERQELATTLSRLAGNGVQAPLARGAATGALWTMDAIDEAGAMATLPGFSDPARLGDFLTGLFALAREAAQRHPALLASIDAVIAAFNPDEFLEAMPSLRLAFSYFTPREKHHLARTLVDGWQGIAGGELAPLPDLVVSVEVAATVMQTEARLQSVLQKYGIRPFCAKEAS